MRIASVLLALSLLLVVCACAAPQAARPTVNHFYANPASISEGDSCTLNWRVADADTVTIDHALGTMPAVGSCTVTPDETTVYELTATNRSGATVADTTVTVSTKPPAVDMPVINQDGLVGRIRFVTAHTSTVMLLTDPDSMIDGQAERSRVRGIVNGQGMSDVFRLKLIFIDRPQNLEAGEAIVTSGMSRILPPGLRIGVVKEVGPETEGKVGISLTPAVDFSRLEHVLVITHKNW